MLCLALVDHPGVPNAQLIKENEFVGRRYKGRSVAEQKSLDIAMDLLNQPRFQGLRGALCETPKEVKRFRQLVINSVMATDLADKELKELRNARWEKAFSNIVESTTASDSISSQSPPPHGNDDGQHLVNMKREGINRKATIVVSQHKMMGCWVLCPRPSLALPHPPPPPLFGTKTD